ncbi:MAG: hypothetical protein QM541_00825 [Flavobacterium sp.]|nr:hypothetical protein [Flavobacterium sp.]
MEQLIDEIFDQLKDYRADEILPNVKMTRNRIKQWVEQFDANDRVFILTELKHIFSKRYCSKDSVKKFLKAVVDKLAKDLGYKSVADFLRMTVFLDLQPNGKSQKIMLKLLSELLLEDYQLNIQDCGTVQKKHFVYIDDILCTGNTLIQDINEWSGNEYATGKTNLEAIKDKSAELIFAYIFIHAKNYQKKKAEMKFKLGKEISTNHKMYRQMEIENNEGSISSSLDFVFPIETEDEEVIEYKDKIIAQVDEHTQRYSSTSPAEFFRTTGRPKEEKLFTSPENRNKFEEIMLKKGIQILNNANVNVTNIRALGFSLKSHKNFGFGTLCFTWRNIANNTPLVFWYAGGGFQPLFVKNQTNVL